MQIAASRHWCRLRLMGRFKATLTHVSEWLRAKVRLYRTVRTLHNYKISGHTHTHSQRRHSWNRIVSYKNVMAFKWPLALVFYSPGAINIIAWHQKLMCHTLQLRRERGEGGELCPTAQEALSAATCEMKNCVGCFLGQPLNLNATRQKQWAQGRHKMKTSINKKC